MNKDYWNGIAENYESEIFGVLADDKENLVTKNIKNFGAKSKVAIDLGCGIGYFLPFLSKSFGKVHAIDFSEKIKYNFVVLGGLNSGDFYNLGQHPFVIISTFADKRLGYKSTVQLGVEVFFSTFLKKDIEYRSISFPSSGLTGDEDYKRVGVFAGHEFRLGDFAIPTQLGYYVYWPYKYESRVYERIGVKYYLNDQWFGVGNVKVHGANAEAIEFGIGLRL